jgi:hypothetical protein
MVTMAGRRTSRAAGARRPNRGLTLLFVLALVAILATTVAVWRTQDPDDFVAGASEAGEALPPTAPTAPSTTTTTPPPPPPIEDLPPVLRAPNPADPLRVWFMGDSTAYAIGTALDALDAQNVLALEVRYTTSSGLARPDFFDWQGMIQAIQDTNPPEAIILSLGANDSQPMPDTAGNLIADIYSDAWMAEYERRVEELALRVITKNTRLYLVGQPIARDESFSVFVNRINTAFRSVADRYDEVTFIDIYDLFRDGNGAYSDFLPASDGFPRQVRRPDGIHLTLDGGARAAPLVWDTLRLDWER